MKAVTGVFCCTALFSPLAAMEFSAIAGIFFQNDESATSLTAPASDSEYDGSLTGSAKVTRATAGYGAYLALDVTYAEISASFLEERTGITGGGPWQVGLVNSKPASGADTAFRTLRLGLSAVIKYPFGTGKFTFFPLAGVDYQFNLDRSLDGITVIYEHGDKAGNYNTLWFRVGAGVDYALDRRVYLRGTAAYGWRSPIPTERDEAAYWKDIGGGGSAGNAGGFSVKAGCGFVLNPPARGLPLILNRG